MLRFRDSRKLESLSLDGDQLTDTTLNVLYDLAKYHQLSEIELTATNSMSDSAWDNLRSVCPNLQVGNFWDWKN